MLEERIRHAALRSRVMLADEAQRYIQNGMNVGVSGFTKCGDVKAIPKALARRAQRSGEAFKINLFTGASLGEAESILAKANLIDRRMPYQGDPTLRAGINKGDVRYVDQHLSHMAEWVRGGILDIDIAVIEATAITENGGIVPTTSVGNSATFVQRARQVIVELNLSVPTSFEGLHDIYLPKDRPYRSWIPIQTVSDRIGTPYIPCDPEKIVAIVVNDEPDSDSKIQPADGDTQRMAEYILEFFDWEVRQGRLPDNLLPLQSGVGSVSNAVLSGLKRSRFENLNIYTEVMQDAVFELFEAGKVNYASASSFALSEKMSRHVLSSIDSYRDKMVLRPQEISNHPEVVRRLGVIAMNTALEVDLYGNVNSTHVTGSKMMNGIGGSGDFARNAALTIFVTKSVAKDGRISSVVPFVSHVDHTEHDVDVLVTEQGIADLRGLAPRERAQKMIEKLVHPDYKDALLDYYTRAARRGGHTPHLMEEALSWHARLEQVGDMRKTRGLVRVQ